MMDACAYSLLLYIKNGDSEALFFSIDGAKVFPCPSEYTEKPPSCVVVTRKQ